MTNGEAKSGKNEHQQRSVSRQRGTNARSNPPARDLNAASRVALALKLRATRMTYEQIALQAGYATASAARKAILRELDRVVSRNVEQLRQEEAHALDMLEAECWKRLADKEFDKSMLFAVDRILAIKERRAKLLGLDTPVDQALNAGIVVVREAPPGLLAPPAATGEQPS